MTCKKYKLLNFLKIFDINYIHISCNNYINETIIHFWEQKYKQPVQNGNIKRCC